MTLLSRLATLLTLLTLFSCQCMPQPADAGPAGDAGRLVARAVEDGFELSLEALDAPLRALQVDVALAGTRAMRLVPAGPTAFDVLEAGLDSPRDRFTAVVADTRRLLLVEGSVARIETEGPGQIQLADALAIDDEGERVKLNLEAR